MDVPPVVDFKNRGAALTVFGVLEIAAGAVCLLAVAALAASFALSSRNPKFQSQPHTLALTLGVYLLAGAAFIWLGIGSILARRWARALWVCASALVFCGGMVTVPVIWLAMSGVKLPPAATVDPAKAARVLAAGRIVGMVFIVFAMLVVPAVLFLFYRSHDVKRTCEVRDPVARWTDSCPLPVLAFGLYAGFKGLGSFAPLFVHGVFPFFGRVVVGPAGDGLALLSAAVWCYSAWGLYRLRPGAWWVALAVVIVIGASNVATLLHGDSAAALSRLGMINGAGASLPLLQSGVIRALPPILSIAEIIWLLSVRRYFAPAPAAPASAV